MAVFFKGMLDPVRRAKNQYSDNHSQYQIKHIPPGHLFKTKRGNSYREGYSGNTWLSTQMYNTND
jgi:hypothetical protein